MYKTRTTNKKTEVLGVEFREVWSQPHYYTLHKNGTTIEE